MKTLFYRMHTDKSLLPASLENSAAGGIKSSCWLIGGGPSFTPEIAALIAQSPAPRMCINLAGTGLIRPNYWTSYDPTERFLKSIYLDSSVVKFVHQRRAMDLVPETTYKVCESPQLYVFERDGKQDYNNFLSQGTHGIVDWQDSMIQGIDILYRLGFRRIFLAGCEMRVRPNAEQIALAEENGVIWQDKLTLKDFVKQCERRGITRNHLQDAGTIELYHFDEQKSLEATVNTDFHYFRISQYLRLSRRAISLAGLELISVTPGSRLHDYFPNITVEQACELIMQDVGNPGLEHTRGLYSQQISRDYSTTCTMQDFPPHRQNHSHKQIKEVPAKPQMKPGPENSASQYNDEAEITIHVNKHKSSRFGQWCKQQIKAEST